MAASSWMQHPVGYVMAGRLTIHNAASGSYALES